jgi:glutamate synthase (NADPH/NADH) small chain
MKFSRIEHVYRPVGQRVQNFTEVERPLTGAEIEEQAKRCMSCGIPFCHGGGCPLFNVIPEMNAAAAAGCWETAYRILSETSNFPEFTSRVCPALCEGSCVNGIHNDAVMIRQLEKAIIERAFSLGLVRPAAPAAATGKKVAVIGSGPAGLAVADELVRAGHQITVFEKDAGPGGLLRYGIPNFKLEKWIIDRRARVMSESGVNFEYGTEVGRDVSAEWLLRRFDAVVVAIGTPEARDLPIPGRNLNNIHPALEFLGAQNKLITGESAELPFNARNKKVLVIGGGDTGSDCVGTALRQEAASVLQIEIMPRPPEGRSASTPWPDWPYQLRTSSSQEEGGERRWNLMSRKFIGEAGAVTGVEAVEVEWELTPDGRPVSFREKPGAEQVIPADLVLLALGFTGVPAAGLADKLGLKVGPKGMLLSDPVRGIFVCGDAARGQSLVVRAIAHARETAKEVNAYLA